MPAYVTVASASIMSWGYNTILLVFFHALHLAPLLIGRINGFRSLGNKDNGIVAFEGVATDGWGRATIDDDCSQSGTILESTAADFLYRGGQISACDLDASLEGITTNRLQAISEVE